MYRSIAKTKILLLSLIIFFVTSIFSLSLSQVAHASQVFGWGSGWYGILGPNGADVTYFPVTLPLPEDIISVKSGRDFGLALDLSGRVWAWGRGYEETPKVVKGLPTIVEIAAGETSAFGLSKDGTVWVWGHDTFGEFGYGRDLPYGSPPFKVPGLSNIVRIACYSYHCLALKNDGTVWTWGYNSFGECGLSPEPSSQAAYIKPRQMQSLGNIISIAAGYSTSYALRIDGTLFIWGRIDLPDKTLTQFDPVAIPSDFMVSQISTAPWTGFVKDTMGNAWSVGSHGGACLTLTEECSNTIGLERMSKAPYSVIMSGNNEAGYYVQPNGTLLVIGHNDHGCLGLSSDRYFVTWDPILLPGIKDVFDVDGGYYTPLVATGIKCHAILNPEGNELQIVKANIFGRAYYLKFLRDGNGWRFRLLDIIEVPAGACGSEAILLRNGETYVLHVPWIEFKGMYFWANFPVQIQDGQVFITLESAGSY